MPYRARGDRAIGLWILYKQISCTPLDDITFIASKDYFDDPEEHRHRWPGIEDQARKYQFDIPSRNTIQSLRKRIIDSAIFSPLKSQILSWYDGYAYMLKEIFPPLKAALTTHLKEISAAEPIEFITSWCNCPSLNAAAKPLGIPIIHNELGPLRKPDYHGTIYFDFNGVNGNTSFEQLAHSLLAKKPSWKPKEHTELLSTLATQIPATPPSKNQNPEKEQFLGVPLQVEDDSNILAFNNGWTNFSLLARARYLAGDTAILVRSHPKGLLYYPPYLGTKDLSSTASAFIQRCKKVISINSSVALEAALYGKPIEVLGEASFTCFSENSHFHREYPKALPLLFDAYCFAYLVPETLLFNWEYYRWRITRPSLKEVRQFHLNIYRKLLNTSPQPSREDTRDAIPPQLVNYWDAKMENLESTKTELENLQKQQNSIFNELEQTQLERDQLQQELQRERQLQQELRREGDQLRQELQRVNNRWEIRISTFFRSLLANFCKFICRKS